MASITEVNAKGDLIVGSGDNETLIVPVGLPDQVLTADPTTRAGVSWQNAAGGSSGLASFTRSDPITGDFGPCGDSGTWTACPAAYRISGAAEVGHRLLWSFECIQQNNAEAVYDIASMVAGLPVRYLSSGTSTPAAAGYGGLYVPAGWPRALAPTWWVVAAEDIDDGSVTLALWYRDNGSGNMLGHDTVAGRVTLANFGG